MPHEPDVSLSRPLKLKTWLVDVQGFKVVALVVLSLSGRPGQVAPMDFLVLDAIADPSLCGQVSDRRLSHLASHSGGSLWPHEFLLLRHYCRCYV